MSGPERLTFFSEVLSLVIPQNLPRRATDRGNPVEWKPWEWPARFVE